MNWFVFVDHDVLDAHASLSSVPSVQAAAVGVDVALSSIKGLGLELVWPVTDFAWSDDISISCDEEFSGRKVSCRALWIALCERSLVEWVAECSGAGRWSILAIRVILASFKFSLFLCRHCRAATHRMWSSNWNFADRAGRLLAPLWLWTVMNRAQLLAGSTDTSTSCV